MIVLPKCILTLVGNVIFPRSWNPRMHNDNILFLTIYLYITRLVRGGLIVPEFAMANPIGRPLLGPEDPLFRLLYGYATLNKLVPSWAFFSCFFDTNHLPCFDLQKRTTMCPSCPPLEIWCLNLVMNKLWRLLPMEQCLSFNKFFHWHCLCHRLLQRESRGWSRQ